MKAAADKLPAVLENDGDNLALFYSSGEKECIQNMKALSWLQDRCISNGSSVEGRITSFRVLTQTLQKTPVLISERTRVIYFPLFGIRDAHAVWIRYDTVMNFKSRSSHETEILFSGGMKMTFPADRRVISGQMKRCEVFLEKLRSIPD